MATLGKEFSVRSEVTPPATVSDSDDGQPAASDNIHPSVSTAEVVIDAVSITTEIPPPDCVLTSGSELEELATSRERDITPISSIVVEVATP